MDADISQKAIVKTTRTNGKAAADMVAAERGNMDELIELGQMQQVIISAIRILDEYDWPDKDMQIAIEIMRTQKRELGIKMEQRRIDNEN